MFAMRAIVPAMTRAIAIAVGFQRPSAISATSMPAIWAGVPAVIVAGFQRLSAVTAADRPPGVLQSLLGFQNHVDVVAIFDNSAMAGTKDPLVNREGTLDILQRAREIFLGQQDRAKVVGRPGEVGMVRTVNFLGDLERSAGVLQCARQVLLLLQNRANI